MHLVRKQYKPQTVESLFNNFWNDEFVNWPNHSYKSNQNLPSVNIEEGDKAFTIDVAVPGYAKEEIKIDLESGKLVISAEGEEKKEEGSSKYTLKEFSRNKFRRSFILPKNKVNNESIEASLNNGVLTITLQKLEEKNSDSKKTIAIQ